MPEDETRLGGAVQELGVGGLAIGHERQRSSDERRGVPRARAVGQRRALGERRQPRRLRPEQLLAGRDSRPSRTAFAASGTGWRAHARCRRAPTSRSSVSSKLDCLPRPAAEQRVVASEQPSGRRRGSRRRRAPPPARAGCRGRRRAGATFGCESTERGRAHGPMQFALHGPTLTLRPPESRPTPTCCSRSASRRGGHALVLVGAVHDDRAAAGLHRRPSRRARARRADRPADRPPRARAGRRSRGCRSSRAVTAACMVGTWFGRAFWGTGANRESKAIVAHLAFELLGIESPGLVLEPRQRALDARAARRRLRPRGRAAGLAPSRRRVPRRQRLRDAARRLGAGELARCPCGSRARCRRRSPCAGGLSRAACPGEAADREEDAGGEPERDHDDVSDEVRQPFAGDERRREPVDHVDQRQRLGDVAQERAGRSSTS